MALVPVFNGSTYVGCTCHNKLSNTSCNVATLTGMHAFEDVVTL